MNLRLIAFCCLLAVSPALSWAQEAGGLLVAVKGRVWIQRPGAGEYRARAGERLTGGTRIRTDAEGQAEVEMDDGSTLVVRERSSIQLSGIQRRKEKKTSLLIFFGRVWNRIIRAAGKQARYELHTPVLVAGVRGTEFEVGVGEDGSVRIVVAEGVVAVTGDQREETLHPKQEIEAGTDGLAPLRTSPERVNWYLWQADKRERLRTDAREIVDRFTGRIDRRTQVLAAYRTRQKEIEDLREAALASAREGDSDAIEQVRQYNDELVGIADRIADLGDAAGSQFGLVDHFAALATDPDFQMIESDYVSAEASRMLKIKEEFDRMVAEGTDISLDAMERMLQQISEGRRGSLKFEKGSSARDLWGDEQKEAAP